MSATFDVRGTSTLQERKLFALRGVIRTGMVHTGMRASLQELEEAFTEPVHAVEHLPTDDGGGQELALLFSYSGPGTLDAWRSLAWEGRTLTLHW